jgi:hypothetical protein
MGFLNPWLLLGLAGIAVPIIIHLLNRFRHRRIDWAAMELLRRALVIRSRRIRIEDLLLLALRCLAVILIALAMARPTLTASGAKWFGAKEEVGAVVAVDGSFSMAYRPGVGSRFDRAVQTVRDLKAALNPGDPVSLVLAGNRPRVLMRNTGYDDRRLEKALKDASPLAEPLNLETCLDQMAVLVRETKAPVRECYLVTDGQAATWERLSEKARRSIQEIGAKARIFVLPTSGDSGENLALTSLSVASGSLRRGTTARLVAEVRNFGRMPQDRVAVTLLAGDKPIDQHVVASIGPGESASVPLFARLDEAGSLRLTARLGQDALDVDNVRHAVARVREKVSVLLVDGSPSDRPFRNETDYLMTALVPKTLGAKSSLLVETAPWVELGSKRPEMYDVVVLANVPDVRPTQVEDLYNFVQEGGGLVVFLGDKVNPAVLNARMRRENVALLPGEVQGQAAAADAAEGRPLAVAAPDHPVARALALLPAALIGETRVQRYFKLAPAPEGRTVLKIAGTDAPLLAERSVGRGKVLLCTSTANRAWNNLPPHPAYPILLHEAVAYLTTRASDRPLVIGEPVLAALPGRSLQTSVTFRGPGGVETAVQVTDRGGRRVAQFDQAEQPGFYEMRMADAPPVVVAVNVDPRESDVRVLPAERLANALAGLPLRVLPEGENLVTAVRETRVGRELWRMLMLAALAVLALEGYLAYRFSRQVAAGEATSASGGRRAADERDAA